MKAIKTKIIATSLAALTCTSFTTVHNKEKELQQLSNKYAVVSDKCFDQLLTNLKDIKAIILIPDTKLEKGKELNLQPVEATKDSVNLENYFRITPTAVSSVECSQNNKITFDDLQLIVYVDKSYADKLSKMNLVKLEGKMTGSKWKLDRHSIKIGDKLNILIDDTSVGFTQVEYKGADK